MNTTYVKEIGKILVAPDFTEISKKLALVGTTAKCKHPDCSNEFVIGLDEVTRAKTDKKGRPTTKIEPWGKTHSDMVVVDVDLTKTPIDFSQYSIKDQAIIFNIGDVHLRFCPECRIKRNEISDTEHSFCLPDNRVKGGFAD